jgi:hypothetical protein
MYEFEKKKLLNSLNEDILELLKNEQCIIAGGSITSLFTRNEINDIDIYFRSKESLINALKEIKEQSTIMAFTDKATMFVKDSSEYAYQFIHFKFFDNPQEIFDTFDFTVCMGAYDFKTDDFIFHPSFLTHNSQRLLKVNEKTAYPIMTALRVQKYLDKGYTISKPEFIKIMLVINQLNIITYKQLKEQMGGMYGVNYDKLFKDIQDNDNFDINVAIETLSDIILDDSYFELPFRDKIDFKHEIEKYINNSYGESKNEAIESLKDVEDTKVVQLTETDLKKMLACLGSCLFIASEDLSKEERSILLGYSYDLGYVISDILGIENYDDTRIDINTLEIEELS